MMDIIISCGATLADIINRHFVSRPVFEKLQPGDPRGSYGEYALQAVDAGTAEVILRRYRWVARCA